MRRHTFMLGSALLAAWAFGAQAQVQAQHAQSSLMKGPKGAGTVYVPKYAKNCALTGRGCTRCNPKTTIGARDGIDFNVGSCGQAKKVVDFTKLAATFCTPILPCAGANLTLGDAGSTIVVPGDLVVDGHLYFQGDSGEETCKIAIGVEGG